MALTSAKLSYYAHSSEYCVEFMSPGDDNSAPSHQITTYTIPTVSILFIIDLLILGLHDPNSDHDIHQT